jgi:hypothetical protein
MTRVISAIIEKTRDRITISLYKRLIYAIETNKYPAPSNNIFNNNSNRIYLLSGFKNGVT